MVSEPHGLASARPVRGGWLLARMNRVAPLGRLYHPLYSLLNRPRGLVIIPMPAGRVLLPAAWPKQATSFLLRPEEQAPELRLLRAICRALKTGCMVDLGANIGLYTLEMRRCANLPIIAYEPQPFLFQLLQWVIEYNRLPDVEARNVACGSEAGEVTFSVGINGSVVPGSMEHGGVAPAADRNTTRTWEEEARRVRAGRVTIKVPLARLDDDLAGAGAVSLLKIDCEGFEQHILNGAREILRKRRPYLFLEVHPTQLGRFGSSVRAVLETLSPDYHLEFHRFSRGHAATKLGRSLLKFRPIRHHQYADAGQMLAAAASTEASSSQFHWIGRPR
jgi:FkbM family methyltransferase